MVIALILFRLGLLSLIPKVVDDVKQKTSADHKHALDGTRLLDPDGDPLAFSWFLDGKAITTGVVAVVLLPASAANISLVADDGLLHATNLVTVQTLTPARAIENLMAAVSGSAPRSQPLLATLGSALASVNRYNAEAAANQIQAFQIKVLAQVSPPALAESLTAWISMRRRLRRDAPS